MQSAPLYLARFEFTLSDLDSQDVTAAEAEAAAVLEDALTRGFEVEDAPTTPEVSDEGDGTTSVWTATFTSSISVFLGHNETEDDVTTNLESVVEELKGKVSPSKATVTHSQVLGWGISSQ